MERGRSLVVVKSPFCMTKVHEGLGETRQNWSGPCSDCDIVLG